MFYLRWSISTIAFFVLFICICPYSASAAVSAGYWHTVVIKTDGSLYAWGRNSSGQLGDGTTIDRHTPVKIGNDTDWADIAAGGHHTVALKTDGRLYAWGFNYHGQLGDGTTTDRHTPIKIGNDTDWAEVSAGSFHTLAIKADGSLYAWGYSYHGELGDGTITERHTPAKIGNDTDWAAVSAGDYHTLALKTDGSLYAWGYNGVGRLGDGTTIERHTPVKIGNDTDWAAVNAKSYHTLALKTDGSLYVWGYNGYGQLGDGTTTDRLTPTKVGNDTDWADVSVGGYHTVAIKTDGSLYTWGWNEHSQLGDGTTTDGHTPAKIGNVADWADVSAGWWHTVAIKTDNSLYTWGSNEYGELGDGTTTNRHTPIYITSLTSESFPDIRGEYSGTYTSIVSNCTDSGNNATYNATLAMNISTQSGNTFSGSATGNFGYGLIEYIQLSGTITESGQISGNTSHTFVDSGGEGTFTGQLSGNTLSIENPGHDTYGDTCTYTRTMSATREGGITPSASFSANPISGNPPLNVNFSDESTGTTTSWNWNFGDGASSTIQNPSHIYTDEGKYSVILIVSGPYGSDTATKTDYISIAKITNGDINNDNVTDLKDAVLGLMTVSGDTSNAINLGADVNGDGKIGLEEVLYILQTIINDRESNQLLFIQFDQVNIASPEEVTPLKCEGDIYGIGYNKLSEFTNMQLNTNSNSVPYSINLIPNGNPSTNKYGILSSSIVDKVLNVSAYNSVIISFWSNSTSNPQIKSIHNCDSSFDILYRLDGGGWQHFTSFCGQHKTETSGWRYMDISGFPILTENASTIEFAFEYYIQNSNGDSSVYYLVDDFKVTGVE